MNGHLDVVQWLYSLKSTTQSITNEVFRTICQKSHLLVARWLYEVKPILNNSKNNTCALRYSCINGDLDFAKWLYDTKTINLVDFHQDLSDYSFPLVCNNGRACNDLELQSNSHLHVAQWLYDTKPFNLVDINEDLTNYSAFQSACNKGHLHVAQWLYQINPLYYIDNYFAFQLACNNGHLQVAQWLYQINYIHNITELFRSVCINGHLNIAQWLYAINPCCTFPKHLLKLLCNPKCLHVLAWLYEINPPHDITNTFLLTYVYGRLNIARTSIHPYLTIPNDISKLLYLRDHNNLLQSVYEKISTSQWLYGNHKFYIYFYHLNGCNLHINIIQHIIFFL
jgi:hypothetical protein